MFVLVYTGFWSDLLIDRDLKGFPRGLFFIELAGSLWSEGLIGRLRASLDFKCLLSNELFDFKEPWVRSSLSEGIKLLKVVSYVTAQRKERKVL